MVMTYEEVSNLLESREGALFWKPRGIKNWDKVNAGKQVLYKMNGYIYASLHGKRVAGHRLMWMLEKGRWPAGQLDHINGIRDDNRIENLRECSNAENNRAVGLKSSNTTGYKGVTLNKASGKYYSYIRYNYKRLHLGVYNTAEEAAIAYNKAAVEHFGEFARLNEI